MEYLVTERLVVDDEVQFGTDVGRCVELINMHQTVAVGTFDEAAWVLVQLGLTNATIDILLAKAVEANDMEGILPSDGSQYALPR